MCTSREEAEAHCKKIYGHINVGTADYEEDNGHYYRAFEDLYWVVDPDRDTGDPGVLGIRPGATPICQHHEGSVVDIKSHMRA